MTCSRGFAVSVGAELDCTSLSSRDIRQYLDDRTLPCRIEADKILHEGTRFAVSDASQNTEGPLFAAAGSRMIPSRLAKVDQR